jgi:hypothetical protein
VSKLDGPLAAMAALGAAWRGDWSSFDGRVLRSQLEYLADLFVKAERGEDLRGDLASFYAINEICPSCCSWTEYCDCAQRQA